MRNGIPPRHGVPGDRHSFLVVEESLGTETIAEYRRSRAVPRRPPLRTRLLVAFRPRAGGQDTPPAS